MPGEDIVQNIALSGQDNVIEAFGEIGNAGAQAFKRVAESCSEAMGPLGELGVAAAGAVAAMGALGGIAFKWAESSSEAVHGLEILATQSGETVESISALQGAMAAVGGSTEGMSAAFRRLGMTISSTWDQIKKEVSEGRDKVINDQLGVEDATESLWKAEQARHKARGDLYALADPATVATHKRHEADLAVEHAEQRLHEAEKKRFDDQRNSYGAIVGAVQSVIKGTETLSQASQHANLNVENVVKGLVGNTEGASEALKNFHGNVADIVGEGPQVKQVLYNLADFLHNSGNAAANTAVSMRVLGRYVGGDMLLQLKRLGSEGLKAQEEEMKRFGLVVDEHMVEPANDFHMAFSKLSTVLHTTTTQMGLLFAPAFTAGMQNLTKYLMENHDALMIWAEDMANKITPYITGFFDSLKGLAAYLSGDKLDPHTNAGEWEASWERMAKAATMAKDAIVAAITAISAAISTLSGATGLKPMELALIGLGGLIGKTLIGAIAPSLLSGLAGILGGTAIKNLIASNAAKLGLGLAPATAAPAAAAAAPAAAGTAEAAVGAAALGGVTGPWTAAGIGAMAWIKADVNRRYMRMLLKQRGMSDTEVAEFFAKPQSEWTKILEDKGIIDKPQAPEKPYEPILPAPGLVPQAAPGELSKQLGFESIPKPKPPREVKIPSLSERMRQLEEFEGKEDEEKAARDEKEKDAEIQKRRRERQKEGDKTGGRVSVPGVIPGIDDAAREYWHRRGSSFAPDVPVPPIPSPDDLGQQRRGHIVVPQSIQEQSRINEQREEEERRRREEDGMASGGLLHGPGSDRSDSIPIMASTGEYVVNAEAVNHYGPEFMDAVNSRSYAIARLARGFQMGGLLGGFANAMRGYSTQQIAPPSMNFDLLGFNANLRHQLDLRTSAGSFTTAVTEDTLRAIQQSALSAKLSQTGQRPSWFS